MPPAKTTQENYSQHSTFSEPGPFAEFLDSIPNDITAMTAAVQGLLIHDYFGSQLYYSPPKNIETASRATLPIADRLQEISTDYPSPLNQPRAPSYRSVGTCRDFALLTCAILRHHGNAARVRCGFAQYFHPPTYEDHWICQYWSDEQSRWISVDSQLDTQHIEHLAIGFATTDLPAGAFLFPWQVWELHQNHPAAFENYGHGDAKGLWFLRVNLARDFLSLSNQETSAWDTWRGHNEQHKVLANDDISFCAKLADLGRAMDETSTPSAATSKMLNALEIPPWHHTPDQEISA